MKNNVSTKMSQVVAILIIAAFTLPSCAKTIAFNTSTIVPAAEGRIKVKEDKNKNYVIEASVRHLAEPQKLQPPKNTYVLWMESVNHGAKNLGQLKSGGFLGSALNASLKTVSSFEPQRFFITAEDDGKVEYPEGQVVLESGTYTR